MTSTSSLYDRIALIEKEIELLKKKLSDEYFQMVRTGVNDGSADVVISSSDFAKQYEEHQKKLTGFCEELRKAKELLASKREF